MQKTGPRIAASFLFRPWSVSRRSTCFRAQRGPHARSYTEKKRKSTKTPHAKLRRRSCMYFEEYSTHPKLPLMASTALSWSPIIVMNWPGVVPPAARAKIHQRVEMRRYGCFCAGGKLQSALVFPAETGGKLRPHETGVLS